jgi:TfoX/Sxy family transcriptional regulator of competence genes
MSFNEKLADRIHALLKERSGMTAKKMFGGIGFLLNGHMCCGVYKDNLILRVGEDMAETLLENEHVKQFDITGRAMKGWVMVESEGYQNDKDLREFVKLSVKFVEKMPAK